jgi:hypothetical protein
MIKIITCLFLGILFALCVAKMYEDVAPMWIIALSLVSGLIGFVFGLQITGKDDD